jgi:hypothetical protein
MANNKKTEEFTNNSWAGNPHFECNSCLFDTFILTEMYRHLVNNHDSEAALEQLLSIEEKDDGSNDIGKDGG